MTTVALSRPAEYLEIDDPVYGTYALSWYCTACLTELGVDLSEPAGEVRRCPNCGTNEHIAWHEWGDVIDPDTGAPLRPGPLADLAFRTTAR